MSASTNANKDQYIYGIRRVHGTSPLQYRPQRRLKKITRTAQRQWQDMCSHTNHNSPDDVRNNCSVVTGNRNALPQGKIEHHAFRPGSKKM
jgi:hypothetical protein